MNDANEWFEIDDDSLTRGQLIDHARVLRGMVDQLEAELAALREQSDKTRAVLLQSGEPDVEGLSELADDVMRRQSRLDDAFDEIKEALGCERDETEMLVAIRGLQDDNAALRARVVPKIAWNRFPMASRAQVGAFRLTIEWLYQGNSTMRWCWWIYMGEARVADGDKSGHSLLEEAESACEAAFLRLVGCGNG